MITYTVKYTLSYGYYRQDNKTVLVRALNEKQAIEQAENHAFKNFPEAQFLKVREVIKDYD